MLIALPHASQSGRTLHNRWLPLCSACAPFLVRCDPTHSGSVPNALTNSTFPHSPPQHTQVATNESYVSVLNHCFDDIEKFIIRLQQAFSAMRELQQHQRHQRRRGHASHSKRSSATTANGNSVSSASTSTSSTNSSGLANSGTGKHHQQQPLPPIPSSALAAGPLSPSELASLTRQSRGPTSDDYFEILSKFKLAFNLLAKLKGCIHEPNAPELVHFLFTPLAIIIESARNGK